MSLDVNGYNAQFKQFVQFAEQQMQAGKGRAVARASDAQPGAPLEGRTITAAKHDWVGIGVGRLRCLKDANNVARDLFKSAIIEMFGTEKDIPPNVKEAMKFADFDKGKPLTARRIIAVRDAIDSSGVAKQRSAAMAKQAAFDAKISSFTSEETSSAALEMGYSKTELPTLAKAVNLFSMVNGCSEADALKEVTTHGSKANRLMKYGGRFLQSAENFKNGLRLLDSFSAWFDKTSADLAKIHKSTLHGDAVYEDGMSKTLLNGSETVFVERLKNSIERFAFEELAYNKDMNLAETDADKLFGMENNQAISCIGRHFHKGRTQTLAQIPPEKRTTFFKALNILSPLYASTAEQAKIHPSERSNHFSPSKLAIPVARILKNLDKLIALDGAGRLDQKSLVKLCFPEIKNPGADPSEAVVNLLDQIDEDIDFNDSGTGKYKRKYAMSMIEAMNSTGCSVKDAYKIAKGEKKLPNVPYFSSGTLELEKIGSVEAGRVELEKDLPRPGNYEYNGGGKLLANEQLGFRYNFPGGKSFVANGSAEGMKNIPMIMDKIEEFCGPIHKEQAVSVMMMTSQSGMGNLSTLRPFGVDCGEHSSIDFTLSKNAETGDITIRYSSPKELPFAFEWTATVDVGGKVSTTPLQFMTPEQIADSKAGANEVEDERLRIENEQLKEAARLNGANGGEVVINP